MSGWVFGETVQKYLRAMYKYLLSIWVWAILVSCLTEEQQAERILSHYIDTKVGLIRNYSIESSIAIWNATVSGNDSDYQKLIDLDFDFTKANRNISESFSPDRFTPFSKNVFANEQDFQMLRKLKYSGLIKDTLLNRQLNVLYQTFMGSQIETDRYKTLIMNEIKLWQGTSVPRAVIRGKMYKSIQLDSIRKNTNDITVLFDIAEVFRCKGQSVEPDILRLVKGRNEYASRFGYPDFYHLTLESKDQTPEDVCDLLNDIELKTRAPFFKAKGIIDKLLAKRYRISVAELRPWNYNDERAGYFSGKFIPGIDSLFNGVDPIATTARFFDGIGLPVQDVIDNSNLKDTPEKKGLTSMINVDFRNDIRLIAGIKNNCYDGMFRMMHLGGHAAHYKSISDDVPYLLKMPSAVVGEGISRYFEMLASNYDWLNEVVQINSDKQRNRVLVFQHMQRVDGLFRCRKLLANAEFEREIYRDPGQNLDSLWSVLNLKYLGLKFPDTKNAGYWATNKFATSLSCSVHNLVLADVFAAQLHHAIEEKVLKKTRNGYSDNKEIGRYLVANLFRYGNLLPWNSLIEKATGEPLNAEYLVGQLLGDETEPPGKSVMGGR